MEGVLKNQLRRFVAAEHIKNVLNGEWVEMFDDLGRKLPGIRGRVGVSAPGVDGHEIGLDLIELQPGSGFPLHTHSGDHILFVTSGEGIATVGVEEYSLTPGDSIFIAAEQPHAFFTSPEAKGAWVIIAIGHPHKHLSATDRMRIVQAQKS